MKKTYHTSAILGILLLSLPALSLANILIEDFEKDDRSSLLSENDFWFVYSDSADAGCQTFFDYDLEENISYEDLGETRTCSYFGTIYAFDGFPSKWYNDPSTFVNLETDEDTTLFFPLRTTSPYTSEDSADGEVSIRQYLETNNTYVGGIYYNFGDAQLMLEPTPTGYNIAEPSYWFVPYVAIGLKTVDNGVTYDLSKCTGISYKYRGTGHNFRADMSTVKDYNYHYTTVNLSDTRQGLYGVYQGWNTATIRWSQLKQESWGVKRTFDASKVTQLVWELKGGNDSYCDYNYCEKNSTSLFEKYVPGVSDNMGDLAIDDITCLTTESEIPVGPVAKSSSSQNRISSSSTKKSSSSATKKSSSSKEDAIIPQKVVKAFSVRIQENGLFLNASSAISVNFLDYQGRVIRSESNLGSGLHVVTFDGLAKGQYIVVINSKNTSKTLQVLVK
mgnify:CR=1 FL=1